MAITTVILPYNCDDDDVDETPIYENIFDAEFLVEEVFSYAILTLQNSRGSSLAISGGMYCLYML